MDVDLQVLAHLNSRPAHGYDLRSRIAASIGDTQVLHNNLIYPALRRLRVRGDIAEEPDSDTRRTTYRITDQGRATLSALVVDASSAAARSEPDFLTRVALFDVVPSGPARGVIASRRELLAARGDHVRSLLARDAVPAWALRVLHHQQRQLAAETAWLDELDAATGQPPEGA